ncbi:MAG: primosomal protein N', partial [Pseudomonadota bacterium]
MQITPEKIAQIAVDVPLSRQFDYLAPGISQADIGRRALVPFGRRLVVGVIVGIAHEPTDPAFQLKRVKEIFYDVPPLPPAVLKL